MVGYGSLRVSPARLERVTTYEDIMQQSSEEHNAVALKMLIAEARRREMRVCGDEYERSHVGSKWRGIRAKVMSAQGHGYEASLLRADLASKYPFLGVLPNWELDDVEERRREMIRTKNVELYEWTAASNSCRSSSSSRSLAGSVACSTDDE